MDYSNLKLIFISKSIYCVIYISWPLQDLNEALFSILWPVLKIFFVLVVFTGTSSVQATGGDP